MGALLEICCCCRFEVQSAVSLMNTDKTFVFNRRSSAFIGGWYFFTAADR